MSEFDTYTEEFKHIMKNSSIGEYTDILITNIYNKFKDELDDILLKAPMYKIIYLRGFVDNQMYTIPIGPKKPTAIDFQFDSNNRVACVNIDNEIFEGNSYIQQKFNEVCKDYRILESDLNMLVFNLKKKHFYKSLNNPQAVEEYNLEIENVINNYKVRTILKGNL